MVRDESPGSDSKRQDRTDEAAPGAIAGLRDGHLVEVELIGVGSDDVFGLAFVSTRHGLDIESIAAALQTAVAAPDRRVTLTVTAQAV